MASEDVRFVFCISFCVVQLGKAVAVEGDWKWGPPVGRSPRSWSFVVNEWL